MHCKISIYKSQSTCIHITTPAAREIPCHCSAHKAAHAKTASSTKRDSSGFCRTKNKGYHTYPANSISKKKNAPRHAPIKLPPNKHSTAPRVAPKIKYQSVHKSPISHAGGTRCRMPICAIPSYGLPHQSLTQMPPSASTPPTISAQVSVPLFF